MLDRHLRRTTMSERLPLADRASRAKIVATIGPASESPDVIRRLILAGVSVFRFNFSHGDFKQHETRLTAIREESASLQRQVAAMGDLPGPKIRVGGVPDGGIELEAGRRVVIAPEPIEARRESDRVIIGCTYAKIVDDVQPGQRVLINDGAIRMLALDEAPGELHCRVTTGGLVTSAKGINLPDSDVSAPPLGERDWRAVEWAVAHGLDFLAMSFVGCAADIEVLRARLEGMCSVRRETDGTGEGARIPIVAKIERPQAVRRMDEIVEAADIIMVARGDLGVEMDIARVPVVQKQLVETANARGKPCIVATQMLESMIQAAGPTRAEATDVANAIFDGAGAVMLSGETAIGRHPVLVVETMRRIINAAEERIDERPYVDSPPTAEDVRSYQTAALAHAAWTMACDMGARLVACWSERSGTARYLSQNDFRAPILAYSSHARWTRRMAMLKGVMPRHEQPPESGSLFDFSRMVERDVTRLGLAREGDVVILLAGRPLGTPKATDTIGVLRVGDPGSGFRA
jgi:pyruvate kinase